MPATTEKLCQIMFHSGHSIWVPLHATLRCAGAGRPWERVPPARWETSGTAPPHSPSITPARCQA